MNAIAMTASAIATRSKVRTIAFEALVWRQLTAVPRSFDEQ